ncbi:MAG: hypothetical protein BZ138_07875 [Methanosphaera sp. rholeuAM270]|nr:MAG: hypothetical protein BZ138_07875 [Methanosphaera sp. rholeuAM270]
MENMPIDNVEWIDVDLLKSNDYNPNKVLNKEMQLIAYSILKNGWIQPILITHDYVIIDGFHRATIGRTNQKVRELTNGKVPCVKLKMTTPERKLLTIRINRAKGTHTAFKMSEIVHELVNKYHIPPEVVAKEIGATSREIELLLRDNVFDEYNINEETLYNQAWVPKKK